MSIKTFFTNKWSFLANGIRRFAFPFVYTILIFLVSAYAIIKETDTDPIFRVLLALVFGLFTSILLTLLAEKYTLKWNHYLIQSISVLATIGCWWGIRNYVDNMYVMMGYMGVCIAVVAVIIFVLYQESNMHLLAPHLLKGAVFSLAVAGILQAGLSLCITAVDAILVDIPELGKYIGILGVFAGAVVAANLFLSGVPKPGEHIVLPKVVKILLGIIGLPIYLLLIAILYVYLAKILITWNLPSNEINLYASFAALFFILFYLTLGSYQEENKLIRGFMKWGKFALIPIILVQLYAIYLRVSAYGITTLRYISMILVGIVLVFLLLAIIKKGKYLKSIFLVIVVAALLFTLTPLNVVDVPDKVQYNRLVQILEANSMYQDGKIVPDGKASTAVKKEVTSIFEYLIYSGGNQIDFINAFREEKGYRGYNRDDFYDTFGFEPDYETAVNPDGSTSEYYSTSFDYGELDVSGYGTYQSDLQVIEGESISQNLEITKENKTVKIYPEAGDAYVTVDVYAVMDQIAEMGEKGKGTLDMEMIAPISKGNYFVTDIVFSRQGDAFYLESISGFALFY